MQATGTADGKATSSKTTFSTECSVAINIKAGPDKIWAIITNAANFPKWNSTVISLDGRIALNEKIVLKSTANPNRTFNLRVSELTPPSKMVWEDGFAPVFKGVRIYTLTLKSDGTTDFYMSEKFGGLMFPMIGGSLPDFRPNFEEFAACLKREAEKS